MIYMLCFTSRKINYLSYINKLLLICIVVLLTTFLTVKCSLPHSSVTEINLPETSTSVYNITLNSFFNFKHPTTKYLLPSAPPNRYVNKIKHNRPTWIALFLTSFASLQLSDHDFLGHLTRQHLQPPKRERLRKMWNKHEKGKQSSYIQKGLTQEIKTY